ncbi:MAG: sortase, partial [Peptococcus niger]
HNIETVLAYEVDQILVVEPWDFEPVLVTPGKDYATLLTCTPYMINSKRLLVRGHRIDYVPPVNSKPNINYQDILPFIIPLAILLLVLMLYFRREYQKKKKLYNELNVMRDEAEHDEQKE